MNRTHQQHRIRPAYTLIEMLIVLVIVAILAAGGISMLGDANYAKLDVAVRLVHSDLDYARSLALSSPTDPVVLQIEDDGTGYHLARASAVGTPISGPNGPLTTTFGVGRAAGSAGVRLETVSGVSGVQFGPFGGISDPVPTLRFTLLDSAQRVTMLLDPLTGDPTELYENP